MASKLFPLFAIATLILSLSVQSGCARLRLTGQTDYRTVATSSIAKPKVAKRKHEKAILHLCDECYPLAEQLLHESLIADASFGPAHNTLGKLYFDQRKFYLAAWEFEHAIKSMPDRAEPVNNLGLVYEAVGKLDDAVAQYEIASSMDPEKAEYLGNLLRCRVRRGEHASTMRPELQSLIELDCREEWVRWAKLKLTTDRTGQDWRQTGMISGTTDFVPVETEMIDSTWSNTFPISNEGSAEQIELESTPVIKPHAFSIGDESEEAPSSRRSLEEVLPFEEQ